jgi:hypothetical protein
MGDFGWGWDPRRYTRAGLKMGQAPRPGNWYEPSPLAD